MYKIYRKSWYPMLSSVVQNAVKNALLQFNFYQIVKGGLISATIFIFGPILKMCKITMLNVSISSGKFWVCLICAFWIPCEIMPISRERILFITVISISLDKTRVEKELSHFYLFLLKNSVEIVLSDCSQDYTHDQLRSDQQWPIRKKIALIKKNLY